MMFSSVRLSRPSQKPSRSAASNLSASRLSPERDELHNFSKLRHQALGLPTSALPRRLPVITTIPDPVVRSSDPFNEPHEDGMSVGVRNSKVRFNRESHPSGHVVKRLNSFLCPAIGLMITLGGIGQCGSTLPSLLDPRLECQHRGTLVRLEVHILLNAVDVFSMHFSMRYPE